MKTDNFFPEEMIRRSYHLHRTQLELKLMPEVFPPSDFVIPFAKDIIVHPGERVVDVGTGSGLLAIMAAKMGGEVYATDINASAVKNTMDNAAINKVKVHAHTGSYFADLKGSFDVIIANLPQEILPQHYTDILGLERANTIDGGLKGNEILIEFLKLAPDFMHRNSRLYVHIGSLSDYKDTLHFISKRFKARMMDSYALPNKPFVRENLAFYQDLNRRGKIHIFKKDKQWMSTIYPFELMLC